MKEIPPYLFLLLSHSVIILFKRQLMNIIFKLYGNNSKCINNCVIYILKVFLETSDFRSACKGVESHYSYRHTKTTQTNKNLKKLDITYFSWALQRSYRANHHSMLGVKKI